MELTLHTIQCILHLYASVKSIVHIFFLQFDSSEVKQFYFI